MTITSYMYMLKKNLVFAIFLNSLLNVSNKFFLKKNDDAFMIVNLTIIVRRYLEWKKKLPRVQVNYVSKQFFNKNTFQPFYAVKCNKDPVIIQILAQLGSGFDCASQAEIKQVNNN